jgi:hypothetical protein
MRNAPLTLALVLVTAGFVPAADEPAKKVEWTDDLSKMAFPDAAVSGRVVGKEFKPTLVHYDGFLRQLVLAQSSGGLYPEVEVRVALFIGEKDKLDGRTFTIDPKQGQRNRPQPSLATSPDGKKLPEPVKMDLTKVAMKLEFGKEKDGRVPGKIYLCLSDADRSVLAGTFEVKVAQ